MPIRSSMTTAVRRYLIARKEARERSRGFPFRWGERRRRWLFASAGVLSSSHLRHLATSCRRPARPYSDGRRARLVNALGDDAHVIYQTEQRLFDRHELAQVVPKDPHGRAE